FIFIWLLITLSFLSHIIFLSVGLLLPQESFHRNGARKQATAQILFIAIVTTEMCHRVVCPDCNKYTWEGCGRHIEQALHGLPPDAICKCSEEPQQCEKAQASSASVSEMRKQIGAVTEEHRQTSALSTYQKLLKGLAEA
ncbi:hypothetical protein BC938DRAFT_475842, partial [Jimgerdemannia flammicorona]